MDALPSDSLIVRIGKFIRFSHTLFALPFALLSMLVAAGGKPSPMVFVWILLCMVGARTAAMGFNRLADWELDQQNPRTADRHKLVNRKVASVLVLMSATVFVLGAWRLNVLCLALAPVALFLIFFYSMAKRFTSYSHFYLGLALAAAPMGAWAAVTGELLSLTPYVLAFGVLLWVFGFDLIYATLDMEFDRKSGLYSFPSRFGLEKTLKTAALLHLASALVFGLFGLVAGLGWSYGVAWIVAVVCLAYEHRLSQRGDINLINKAFFQVNVVVSLALLLGTMLDLLIYGAFK